MIQRIQTLYLAVAAALAGFLIKGNIVTLVGSGSESYNLTFKGILDVSGPAGSIVERSIPLTIIIISVAILFLIAIFLFKVRKLQIRVTVLASLLSLGTFLLLLYYIFITGRSLEAGMIFNIKLVFPLVCAILGYLAFRSILKDELLVKSYDRIR